ncbi:MAG: hypothetical protein KUG77_01840 [Nannocystaceae bacterium]|nr:hypothetical protein [Nannocystaceae bacterium]
MRTLALFSALLAPFVLTACDSNQEPIVEPNKSKKPSELKQAKKEEMSAEELAEARKKAGFVSPEEQMAEAKAIYEKEEKAFVKGRLESYRKMLKDLRGALDSVEKGATKWAKAKDSDKAFGKFKDGYSADNKAFMKAYRELTEKESRGGDVQVKLGGFISAWENFNGDLSGKIADNEKFGPTLEELRKALTAVEAELDAIEKDESIEAQPPKGAEGDDKKKKK